MQPKKSDRDKAADIVRDAGGEIVGRTRLQKTAFLLELVGCGDGFRFEYRHYGPYSEELANAIYMASVFELVEEEERRTSWGGMYSIYRSTGEVGERTDGMRASFAHRAANIDSIELELAATAAYLYEFEDCEDPWDETARRKPGKAREDRLERAKEAYRSLLEVETPKSLPKIV